MRIGALAAALLALFVVHNDLWWWDDPALVLGLPIGLLYHVGFCFAAAIVMAVASRRLRADGSETSDTGSEPGPTHRP